jgi:hypothetical protein
MNQRCFNKNNPGYFKYGGRGITVCQEWQNSFDEFYNWSVKNGYNDDLTIDRINNNGNYTPDNCRWVTYHTQNNNTRANRLITFKGETMTMAQWANKINIHYSALEQRLNQLGWSVEKALTTPRQGLKS